MKIFLATDHRGFKLKEEIKLWLADWGYNYEDMGAYEYDSQDDYPDFIAPAAAYVAGDPAHRKGIFLGFSGQGEALLANKYHGVRAAVYYGGQREIIRLSREHNDANVLSIGAGFVNEETAKRAIKIWLETKFGNEPRHSRRIKKIGQIEEGIHEQAAERFRRAG